MIPLPDQIGAVQHFAPPLLVPRTFDRRGATIHGVSPKAVAYARRAGFGLDLVYPREMAQVRQMAPERGTGAARDFLLGSGLTEGEVYSFGAEAAADGFRWGRAFAGFAVGAMAGGPLWALVMGAVAGAVP